MILEGKKLTRAISSMIAMVFLCNELVYAAPNAAYYRNGQNLAPNSRIKPMQIEETDENKYRLVERQDPAAPLVDAFRENVDFMYISLLIGDVLANYNGKISPETLKELIEKQVKHDDLITRIKWKEMYTEDGAFFVPYLGGENGGQEGMFLKYRLVGDEYKMKPGETIIVDEKNKRGERKRVICEATHEGMEKTEKATRENSPVAGTRKDDLGPSKRDMGKTAEGKAVDRAKPKPKHIQTEKSQIQPVGIDGGKWPAAKEKIYDPAEKFLRQYIGSTAARFLSQTMLPAFLESTLFVGVGAITLEWGSQYFMPEPMPLLLCFVVMQSGWHIFHGRDNMFRHELDRISEYSFVAVLMSEALFKGLNINGMYLFLITLIHGMVNAQYNVIPETETIKDIKGVFYYPASGADFGSMIKVIKEMPNITDFVFVDKRYTGLNIQKTLFMFSGIKMISKTKETDKNGDVSKITVTVQYGDRPCVRLHFYAADILTFTPPEIKDGAAVIFVKNPGYGVEEDKSTFSRWTGKLIASELRSNGWLVTLSTRVPRVDAEPAEIGLKKVNPYSRVLSARFLLWNLGAGLFGGCHFYRKKESLTAENIEKILLEKEQKTTLKVFMGRIKRAVKRSSEGEVSSGDGFIANGKFSPELLQNMRAEGRITEKCDMEKVKKAIEYLKSLMPEIREKFSYPQTEGEQKQFPEYLKTVQSGIERLEKIAKTGNVKVFDAIVNGIEDYALGFGDENEIGVAKELMDLDIPLLAELLFHEAICSHTGHDISRRVQTLSFTRNYEENNSILKNRLREVIDKTARTVNEKDTLEDVKTAAENFHIGQDNIRFIDSSCYLRNEYVYAIKRFLETNNKDEQYVLYGTYDEILSVADFYKNKAREAYNATPQRNCKAIVDRKHGLVGGIKVPEAVSEILRASVEGDKPVLIDIKSLQVIDAVCQINIKELSDVVPGYVRDGKLDIPYKAMVLLIDDSVAKAKESELLEEKEEAAGHLKEAYEIRQQNLGYERVRDRIIKEMDRDSLKKFIREAILSGYLNRERIVKLREMLVGQTIEGSEFEEILFGIYLDGTNNGAENERFRDVFLAVVSYSVFDKQNILSEIDSVLRDKDINSSYKVIDLLLRLKISEGERKILVQLIPNAYYGKEIITGFCLLYEMFFKGEAFNVHYGYRASPILESLGPESKSIYYYLTNIERKRSEQGKLGTDAQGRVLYYTKALDGFSGHPGEKQWTWFSSLRIQVHSFGSSADIKILKKVFKYLKDGDEEALGESSITRGFIKDFNKEKLEAFARIFKRFICAIYNTDAIDGISAEEGMEKILNVPEESAVEFLKQANHGENEEDVENIENMIRLYYAFNDFYGISMGAGISLLKNLAFVDEDNKMIRLSEMVDFMEEDYKQLLSVIDDDDPFKVLPAVAACRNDIKKFLLSQKPAQAYNYYDERDPREALLEIDTALNTLGQIMVSKAAREIDNARNVEDIKKHMPLVIAMGRFIAASGLGGVDFEQFLYQLERGHNKYSQVHDLTRAMRTEVHKIRRRVNETMRIAAKHIFDDAETDKLREEWQKDLKTEKIINYGKTFEEDVISEEGKNELEMAAIDKLIRESGIDTLDQALGKINEILEMQLTEENDGYLDGKQEEEIASDISEQFLRFGQPEVIPRDPLIGSWSKKGLNLEIMTKLGYPVPPGVIASSRLITHPEIYKSPEFKEEVKKEIELIRKHSKYPDLKLLMYARSGSAFLLPGLMVTIPNLGMNDKEAEELAKVSADEWFAYDTYAEFMRSFAINILGIPEEYFQEVVNIYEKDNLSPEEMKEVCQKYKKVIEEHGKGAVIPDSMIDQMMMAIDAVYASWDSEDARSYRARHKISQEWGTVVILQKGVFGNLNTTSDGRISGTGAGALRILPDGRELVQGKFRFRSIGDQLMSRAEQNYILLSDSEKVREDEQTLESLEPVVYKEILEYAHRLKEDFGNNQHFEFTVEMNKVWLTQTNDDVIREDFPEFGEEEDRKPIGRGHGVSGGAIRGWVANSVEAANALAEKYKKEKPRDVDGVILFLDRVNPEQINRIPKDVHIVAHVISVHAETLAQKYGITAVYGIPNMRYNSEEKVWYIGEERLNDGCMISMDGHENQLLYHNSGKIFLGSVPIKETKDSNPRAERRSPRALEKIGELRDMEQKEAAKARIKEGLSGFEKEVLIFFEEYMEGKVAKGELARYLANYRAILDKVARRSENLNFDLYGEEFRKELGEILSDMGIKPEVFRELYLNYYPYGRHAKEILDKIDFNLRYAPEEYDKQEKEYVEVYDDGGEKIRMTKQELLFIQERTVSPYYIVNKPEKRIKMVSFEVEDVLDPLIQRDGDPGKVLIDIFKAIKNMDKDVRIVITSSAPRVKSWFSGIESEYPELKELVESCWEDTLRTPYLNRYVSDECQPDEILHFSGINNYGFDMDRSPAAILHEEGFKTVLVGRSGIGTNPGDIIRKDVDAFMPRTSAEAIKKIAELWIHPDEKSRQRDNNRTGELLLKECKKQAQEFINAVKSEAYSAKKQNEAIISIISTRWLPEEQRNMAAMRMLQDCIEDIKKEEGLNNVFTKFTGEEHIAGAAENAISAARSAGFNVPKENIIFIGEEDLLTSSDLDGYRDMTLSGKGAFFGFVAPEEGFGSDSYASIVEIMHAAFAISKGGQNADMFNSEWLKIKPGKDPRTVYFVPSAKPVGIQQLPELYNAQQTAIKAA